MGYTAAAVAAVEAPPAQPSGEPSGEAGPSGLLPPRVLALPRLTKLIAAHNQLGDRNARTFAVEVLPARRSRITELRLDDNGLEEPPRNLVQLAKLQYVEDPFPRYL